jgi:hypothetical protein
LAGDTTPAQRVHDEAGEVHDVGTGLPALAHTGASVGARRAAKHQPRGFMIELTGVHDDRKAWAIAWLTPMNRNATFPSDRSPSPSVRRTLAEPTAAERRPERRAVRLTPYARPRPPGGEGIWPAHSAEELLGWSGASSLFQRHGCAITPAPPVEQQRRAGSLVGSLSNRPSLG